MKYRTLGRSGLTASVIGIGTWQFGGEWGTHFTQNDVDGILDQALDCGINLIDTAECYGDHVSESLIGNYLSRRDRSRWIIATKFGHQFNGFMDRSWRLAPADVEQQLHRSLQALKIERIDVYQFHSGSDEDFQQPELWSLLERQKRAGKIRHLGVSISSKAGPRQAEQAKAIGADVLQVLYNRLDRRAEKDFLPHALRDNLGVLARVPLASGFLTGKYGAKRSFALNDMRSTIEEAKREEWVRELDQIRQSELPAGMPMAEWALAWCLKNPVVTSVIPGCKDPAHVRMNAAAAVLVEEPPEVRGESKINENTPSG